MKLQLTTLLTLSLFTGLVSAADSQRPVTSGIIKEYNDPSVRPQDDFFDFMHGNWIKKTPIPPDQSSWGAFEILASDTLKQLRELIEAIDPNQATDLDAKKIGDFYASFMDEAKLEALGASPLQADLARIAALENKKDLSALCASMERLGVSYPFSMSIEQDARESSRYAVNIVQDGLGMPDRDYYLKSKDPKLAAIRSNYLKHIETMLGLVGDKDAASHAKEILAL